MKEKSFLQLQAYDYIKEKILSNEFKPDTLYSETKLSAQIGISRTPMREALQCLSQDGYITIIPSKGFKIRTLTDKDMLESIQVRCAIEGYCTHIISTQIYTEKGKRLLQDLERLLEKMRTFSQSPETLKDFIQIDHEFHLKIVNYIDNHEFNQLFQRLLYLIRLTSENALSKEGRIQGTLSEHEEYYEALCKGDTMLAYKLMLKHLMMPIEIRV